jgi:hypothetical protein
MLGGPARQGDAWTNPRLESVHRVDVLQSRPIDQVGSVTTTGGRFELLFDWDRVPSQLGGERLLALMDDFFELGPMGLHGPAVRAIPNAGLRRRRRHRPDRPRRRGGARVVPVAPAVVDVDPGVQSSEATKTAGPRRCSSATGTSTSWGRSWAPRLRADLADGERELLPLRELPARPP